MSRSLVPWDVRTPRMFDDLRQEMNQLFDQFFGGAVEEGGEGRALLNAPRLNVAETDSDYEVTLDMPGMKPEDFSVEYHDGALWISGERREEHEEKGKTFHRVERQFGRFRRVVQLGSAVNLDKIQAEYREGVLQLTIPKTESAKPRKIAIKSGG